MRNESAKPTTLHDAIRQAEHSDPLSAARGILTAVGFTIILVALWIGLGL